MSKNIRNLRREHDNVNITDASSELIVKPIAPKSRIRVTIKDGKRTDTLPPLTGMLFIINPLEFGIEIIQPVYFEMDDNDYIIDGEIWEVENALVRQPVVLISYEYLCQLYNNNKSLGKYVDDINNNSRDGKILERIPPEEYYVFAADVKLKEIRLNTLKTKGKNRKEQEFLEDWIKKYKNIFEEIGDKWGEEKPALEGDRYREILTLCPATWKSIELLCESGIDKNYLDRFSELYSP